MNLTGYLIRLAVALLAVYVGWTLLNAYALPLFLMCAAVAGWRLWRTAASLPDQARGFRPGADRPRQPTPGEPETGENSTAPAVAPVVRSSRSLDRALAELDGMNRPHFLSGPQL